MILPNAPAREVAPPAVTVSVVSHGQGPLCLRLIADLAQFGAGSIANLILTLNIPEPLALPGGLPFPVEIVRNAQPQGFGANHNRAFARARGAYFAVLNPDLRLDRDPFPALLRHLADPSVGVVAPQVLEPDGSVADSTRALVSPWEVLRRHLPPRGRRQHCMQAGAAPDWIAGMFLVFRSATYASLGGFDARYFLYCEDVDICARLRLQGLRLELVREVQVTHEARRESHRSFRRLRMHVTSLIRLWSSPVYHRYRRQLKAESARMGGARGPG
jgi:hypothetical protein